MSAATHGGECATKRVWGADTFSGIPSVAEAADEVASWPPNSYAASVATVRATMRKLGLEHAPFGEIVGRFNESLPTEGRVKRLAVLRVDADTREGTTEALEAVHARLADGAVVIIDDFHLKVCISP